MKQYILSHANHSALEIMMALQNLGIKVSQKQVKGELRRAIKLKYPKIITWHSLLNTVSAMINATTSSNITVVCIMVRSRNRMVCSLVRHKNLSKKLIIRLEALMAKNLLNLNLEEDVHYNPFLLINFK